MYKIIKADQRWLSCYTSGIQRRIGEVIWNQSHSKPSNSNNLYLVINGEGSVVGRFQVEYWDFFGGWQINPPTVLDTTQTDKIFDSILKYININYNSPIYSRIFIPDREEGYGELSWIEFCFSLGFRFEMEQYMFG